MTVLSKNTIWLCLTAIFLLCYRPGLNSPFLFDDYGNLDKLGDFNGVRNLDTFFRYLFSGIAGPLGRPLSLLSFLIDGNTWPTEPLPFKRTNILLHFFSGMLLFVSIRNIASALDKNHITVFWTAFIASALWLLHPFLVSTVLYAVQRMAMLSAFFSLLGILAYSHGRLLLDKHPVKAYRIMTLAVIGGTGLAILSKENGVLLPLLILVIEKIIFCHPCSNVAKINNTWFSIIVGLPCLIIMGYLAKELINFIDYGFGGRSFTLSQRLLTETHIESGYLYNLLIPQMLYPGLFYENYPLSTSIVNPVSTLAATLFIVALPVTAYLFRLRFPFFSMAVFFFYAGHLLESTFLPLELYFEHRNYLPAVFLFLPLGRCFALQSRFAVKAVIVFYLVICAFFTYQTTSLWGKPLELALVWAQQNPTSERAQQTAVILLEHQNQQAAAMALMEKAMVTIPDSMAIKLHGLILKCKTKTLQEHEFYALTQQLPVLEYSSRLYNLLDETINTATNSTCPVLDATKAIKMLDALLQNPTVNKNKAIAYQIHYLKGRTYASNNASEQAAKEFVIALDFTHRVEHGLMQTAILASNKFYKLALIHLDKTEQIYLANKNPSLQERLSHYGDEIKRLRDEISDDILKSASKQPIT